MDIEAANGDGMAVTSVTLWDGDSDDVIHYDFTYVIQTEFCLCCFDTAPTTVSRLGLLRFCVCVCVWVWVWVWVWVC